ncbi:MAG: CHASE2 domain-containing protein, partial [Chloroflexota bacterium]
MMASVFRQVRAWRLQNVLPRLGSTGFRRNAHALLLILPAAALASTVQVMQANAMYPGAGLSAPLYALETALQDAVLRSQPPDRYGSSIGRDPRSVLTLIAMDESSLAELGVFRSWPRAYYAHVLNNLLVAPPRVVGFDVGFFDTTPDDPDLAAAFERARAQRPPTSIVLGDAGSGRATMDADGIPTFGAGLQPVNHLADLATVAFTNVLPDERGVVRSMPLVASLGGQEQFTLGLAVVNGYLRLRDPTVARQSGDRLALNAGGATVRQVPVDATNSMRLHFFGPPSEPNSSATFRVVSFADVLRGRADPTLWRDGIVLIGFLGTTGFADDWWTPVSDQGRKMAGVEVHANVAATLLSSEYLRTSAVPIQVAVIVGLALLVGLIAANVGGVRAALATLAVLGAYLLLNLAIFDALELQLPLADPLAAGGVVFVAVTAYREIVGQRQASVLQAALASVIPPSVARELARNPEQVRIGGERRVVSVLFTDLVGFTAFSETVQPEVVASVIRDYLEAMTAVIFQYRGTVDKFIGDGVMALFNAPLDDAEHARQACDAALAMQAALATLNRRWEGEGLPGHSMRIGIHTGPAHVGNMGTSLRFAYTALGDTVNLAARLEPLNNVYGSAICTSEATLQQAGGPRRFLVRFLDLVQVRGRQERVAVYELLGRTDDQQVVSRWGPLLRPYGQAVLLYQARDFVAASSLFLAALEAVSDHTDRP